MSWTISSMTNVTTLLKLTIFNFLASRGFSYNVEITQGSFDKIVTKSGKDWIIEFYTPWCGHCKEFGPIWASIGRELHETPIQVGSVDASKNQKLSNRFKAKSFPYIILLRNGQMYAFNRRRNKGAVIDFAYNGHDYPAQQQALDRKKAENAGIFYKVVNNYQQIFTNAMEDISDWDLLTVHVFQLLLPPLTVLFALALCFLLGPKKRKKRGRGLLYKLQ